MKASSLLKCATLVINVAIALFLLEKPLAELVGMVERKEVRYHRDLLPEIFAKIKAAVLASRLVSDELKELL